MRELTNIKQSIITMIHRSRSSHVGSCLSVCEILYTLYFKILRIDPASPQAEGRDKFVLSKGHASAALYATLAERGFFPKERLNGFYVDNGTLPGHLDKDAAPGIEASSGSLGHGLSIGVGMALANRLNRSSGNVYVLLGDGECNEGSVWEAVMLASTLSLSNLTAIVDFNKLQGFGKTHEVIDQQNMPDRWKTFGWDALEVDGHDVQALEETFGKPHDRPKVIIAHTIKGKGVCFMENKLDWHYRSPDDQQCQQALKELEEAT